MRKELLSFRRPRLGLIVTFCLVCLWPAAALAQNQEGRFSGCWTRTTTLGRTEKICIHDTANSFLIVPFKSDDSPVTVDRQFTFYPDGRGEINNAFITYQFNGKPFDPERLSTTTKRKGDKIQARGQPIDSKNKVLPDYFVGYEWNLSKDGSTLTWKITMTAPDSIGDGKLGPELNYPAGRSPSQDVTRILTYKRVKEGT